MAIQCVRLGSRAILKSPALNIHLAPAAGS